MIKLVSMFLVGFGMATLFLWGTDCRRAAQMEKVVFEVSNRTEGVVLVRSLVSGPAIPPKVFEIEPAKTVDISPWPHDVPVNQTEVALQVTAGEHTFAIQMSALDIGKLTTMHGKFLIEATDEGVLMSFFGADLVR